MFLPLKASDLRAFGLQVPGGVSPRLGEGKLTKKKIFQLCRVQVMRPSVALYQASNKLHKHNYTINTIVIREKKEKYKIV